MLNVLPGATSWIPGKSSAAWVTQGRAQPRPAAWTLPPANTQTGELLVYQLLPVLLEGLPPADRRSMLERLQTPPESAPGTGSPIDRPVAPAPSRPRLPVARTGASYRPRPTAEELDAIAAAPWRGAAPPAA